MTEDEIRQLAENRNFTLRRSSVTDPAIPGYGIFWLHEATTGVLVYRDRWGAELSGIEKWLKSTRNWTKDVRQHGAETC